MFPKPPLGRDGNRIGYLGEEAHRLPPDVWRVYTESIEAICNDLNVLAGIGIRAIVQAVCKDLGMPKGSLLKQIDALVEKGVITPDGAELLHDLRDRGNDAAHEFAPLTSQQVEAAMKVVDHLLIGAYIVKESAKHLRKPKVEGAAAAETNES